MEKSSKAIENAAHSLESVGNSLADAVLSIMDKLAGKESDIRLTFDELTLDTGIMKTKLNGSIILDIVYAKEIEK
jgi:hypothetical protein